MDRIKELLNTECGRRGSAIWSLAHEMIRQGYDEENFITVVLDPDHRIGEHWQGLPEHRAVKDLSSIWSKAENYHGNGEGPGVVGHHRKVLQAALNFAWKNQTDRRVLTTILEMAIEKGVSSPGFGTRAIAERANIGHMTVARSLKRLIEFGWLQPHKRNGQTGRGKATEYTTHIPESCRSDTPIDTAEYIGVSKLQHSTRHDIFTWGAAGLLAERIWLELDHEGEFTVADVAKVLKVSKDSARRALNRMVDAGLLSKEEGFRRTVIYRFNESVDLDEALAAKYPKKVGLSERRKELHRQQREGMRNYEEQSLIDLLDNELVDEIRRLCPEVPVISVCEDIWATDTMWAESEEAMTENREELAEVIELRRTA